MSLLQINTISSLMCVIVLLFASNVLGERKKKTAEEIHELLAVEYESKAMSVKVNTDDEYQVRGLPTPFFISPDPIKDAIRTEGLIPIHMMRDIIYNEM